MRARVRQVVGQARGGVRQPPDRLGCGCRPGCGCVIGTLWLAVVLAAAGAFVARAIVARANRPSRT